MKQMKFWIFSAVLTLGLAQEAMAYFGLPLKGARSVTFTFRSTSEGVRCSGFVGVWLGRDHRRDHGNHSIVRVELDSGGIASETMQLPRAEDVGFMGIDNMTNCQIQFERSDQEQILSLRPTFSNSDDAAYYSRLWDRESPNPIFEHRFFVGLDQIATMHIVP